MTQHKEDIPLVDTLAELQSRLTLLCGVFAAEKMPIRVQSPKGHILEIVDIGVEPEVPAMVIITRRP